MKTIVIIERSRDHQAVMLHIDDMSLRKMIDIVTGYILNDNHLVAVKVFRRTLVRMLHNRGTDSSYKYMLTGLDVATVRTVCTDRAIKQIAASIKGGL